MISVLLAIFGSMEPQGIFYKVANITQGLCILIILALYFKNLINIRYVITFILSICTVEIVVELFHQALYDGSRGPTEYYDQYGHTGMYSLRIHACICQEANSLHIDIVYCYIQYMRISHRQ